MSTVTLEQALQAAVACHQQGRWAEAEALYRRILAAQPKNPDALHLLGVLAHQTGHPEAAIDLISRAIAEKGDDAYFHCNLGEAYRAVGRMHEAVASYQNSLAIMPDLAETHNNIGNAFLSQGRTDEAIKSYQKALALKPEMAEAHNNLGKAWKDSGQFDEALLCFHKALTLKPDYPEAYNNLGTAFYDKGRLDEAAAYFEQAIHSKPDYATAHTNLGAVMVDKGDMDAAIQCCRQALEINPEDADALNTLGVAWAGKGEVDKALVYSRMAIEKRSDSALFLHVFANALLDQGNVELALDYLRRTIQLAPAEPLPHSTLIYALHLHEDSDSRAIFSEHLEWDRRHGEPRRRHIRPHSNNPDPERRLKIGYVSPDLREHPVGRFLLPLLENHDREHFEIICYAEVARPDSLTKRLRAQVERWRDTCGSTEEQLAEQVREDGIDVLVDLALHTGGNRLTIFARKPAPVQVSFAGYPDTTGLTAIDYRLSDPFLEPPGDDDFYSSEKIIRLPDSFWLFAPPEDGPNVNPTPVSGKGQTTFGCLGNFGKINASGMSRWAKVLHAVPHSRLLLLAGKGSHREQTRETLQGLGVAADRIEFAEPCPRLEYFALYQQVDIVLDTAPYNGHNTSLDALWMGVPVVSLVGQTAVGRGGLSILSNIGLPELAARTEDEYVNIALELANDLPRLAHLRETMRKRMQASPLMDASRFARNMEDAYRNMWRKWCEGKTKESPPGI